MKHFNPDATQMADHRFSQFPTDSDETRYRVEKEIVNNYFLNITN